MILDFETSYDDSNTHALLRGIAEPARFDDAANKCYVDSLAQGLHVRQGVDYATLPEGVGMGMPMQADDNSASGTEELKALRNVAGRKNAQSLFDAGTTLVGHRNDVSQVVEVPTTYERNDTTGEITVKTKGCMKVYYELDGGRAKLNQDVDQYSILGPIG